MKLGITGQPKSGKTTIFNAITKQNIDTNPYGMKAEPNIAMVQVLDPRITFLSELYKPKKTTYANVEFLDFPGMIENANNNEFLSPASMALLKLTDALVVVLRNFNDSILDDTYGKPNPEKDLKNAIDEFILSDLAIAEKRLEKILLNNKRGVKTATSQIEEKAIRTAIEKLNEETSLRDVYFPEDELKAIKGFQFLSIKPIMVILNSDEDSFGKNQSLIENLTKILQPSTSNLQPHNIYEFVGKLEMELSMVDEEDAIEIMNDMNIKQNAVMRAINGAYSLLGCISFFTVGTDEVRAWTIQLGETALIAAGKIHSDLARGFIRAETFTYLDLFKHGSEKVIREKGLFRLEGKTYLVQDGDIINIRFNV